MTKIDIYSGFLGAGKTTLIKKLIAEAYAGETLVLIENEFGEIGVDGGFLQDAGIVVNEMNSGCICCSLVGDFAQALTQVMEQYAPERILIEPSGVGKLTEVVQAVKNALGGKAELGAVAAVADAGKCKMYMKNFGEFYNDQISAANTVVLSRTQNMTEDKLNDCVARIRTLNPHAVIITTPWDQLTGAQLRETLENRNTLDASLEQLREEESHCCCGGHGHHHDHDHEHHEGCCGGHGHHDHDHDHEHHEGCCGGHGHHHDHDHEHHEGCCGGHGHHDHDQDHEHHEGCSCGHDHHDHHHADEVFSSWGVETPKQFAEVDLRAALEHFSACDCSGTVLRAKGIVAAKDGGWFHFDYVPGEIDLRRGSAAVTGRICVIGSGLREDKLAELFGV